MKKRMLCIMAVLVEIVLIGTSIIVVTAPNVNSLGVPVLTGEHREGILKTVVLTWTEDPNATSYRIYRSQTSEGEKEFLGQETSKMFVDM